MSLKTLFAAVAMACLLFLPGCGENEAETRCPTGIVRIGDTEVEARLYCPPFNPYESKLSDISFEELMSHSPETFPPVLFPEPDWKIWVPAVAPDYDTPAAIEDAKRGNPFACVALAQHFSFKKARNGTVAFWLIQADILAGRPGWSLGLFGALDGGWHGSGPYWALGSGDVFATREYPRDGHSLGRAAGMGDPWSLEILGMGKRAALAGLPLAMRDVAWSSDDPTAEPLLKEAARRGDIVAWSAIAIRFNIQTKDDPEQIVPACAAWATSLAVEADKFPPGTPHQKTRQWSGHDAMYDAAGSYERNCRNSGLTDEHLKQADALKDAWFGEYRRYADETLAAQRAYRAKILPEVIRNIESRP